ncbi:hypothetical protein Leryth_008013 [Lithospermum erythrorhizon]|nr:hypothetical protein Leryth_008013 [Lithospermum erythrorhizon]
MSRMIPLSHWRKNEVVGDKQYKERIQDSMRESHA